MDIAEQLAKLITERRDGRTLLSHLVNPDNVFKWGDSWQTQERGPDGRFGSGSGETRERDFQANPQSGSTGSATQEGKLPESGRVPEFKTLSDCKDWLVSQGVDQTDAQMKALAGVGATPEDMHHVCGVIDKYNQDFPGLWKALSGGIGTLGEADLKDGAVCAVGRGQVSSEQEQLAKPSDLELSKDFFDCQHNPELFRTMSPNGWSTCRSADDLMTHEVGHAIQSMALDHAVQAGLEDGQGYEAKSDYWGLSQSAIDAGFKVSPFAQAAIDTGLARSGVATPQVSEMVSEYASQSPRELASEAFVMQQHPEELAALSPADRATFDKYVGEVNTLMGTQVIKAKLFDPSKSKGTGRIVDTFFPKSFWEAFRAEVAKREAAGTEEVDKPVSPKDELAAAARKAVLDEIAAVEDEIRRLVKGYNPDQPRDEHGRFGSGGSAGGESHDFQSVIRAVDKQLSGEMLSGEQRPEHWDHIGKFVDNTWEIADHMKTPAADLLEVLHAQGEMQDIDSKQMTPQDELDVKLRVAGLLQSGWFGGSGGTSHQEYQDAAKAEFDLKGTKAPYETPDTERTGAGRGDEPLHIYPESVMRDFVRAQYEATQAVLERAGFGPNDTITLYRTATASGANLPEDAQVGDTANADFRPLTAWGSQDYVTSFQAQQEQTYDAVRGDGETSPSRVVYSAEIPIRDIASIGGLIGMGDSKDEMVVLGRTRTVTVDPAPWATKAYNPDQPRDEDGRFGSGGGDSAQEPPRSVPPQMVDAINQTAHDESTKESGHPFDKLSDECASEMKAMVAKDIAEHMKSSTSDLLKATGLLGGHNEPIGKPIATWTVTKDSSGKLTCVRSADVRITSANDLKDYNSVVSNGKGLFYAIKLDPSVSKDEFESATQNLNGSAWRGNMYAVGEHFDGYVEQPSVMLMSQNETSARLLGQTEPSVRVDPSSKAFDTMLREDAVSSLVSQWARSANDSNPQSLAIQECAARTLGITNPVSWKMDDKLTSQVSARVEQTGATLDEFVKAQYDATQRVFASLGYKPTDAVSLYRGQTSGISGKIGDEKTVALRPLSSWTTDLSIASESYFSEGGKVIRSDVPIASIVALPSTGVGCLRESEVVIKGNPIQGTIVRRRQ